MRRISDEDRVVSYFKTATEPDASAMLRVVAAIIDVRFPAAFVLVANAERQKRGRLARKPKAVTAEAAP